MLYESYQMFVLTLWTISSLGFLKQLKETIEQINEEISHPRFVNTDQEYMEMLLDVKSEERVIDDLKMYATALEWSVMQFHKAKMIQINEIISRLWMNIYRGNDFNNIIIRTDETVVKGPSSKRSYNYRLVICRWPIIHLTHFKCPN